MNCKLPCVLALLVACGEPGSQPPPVSVCPGHLYSVSSDAQLGDALSTAVTRDCIELAAGTYAGGLSVPGGVSLKGPATVQGSPDRAAITFGAGAKGEGFTVHGGRLGVFVDGAGVKLKDVTIEGADGGAVGIRCEDPSCLGDSAETTLDGVVAKASAYGVLVKGARVKIVGGEISGHQTDGLTGGAGVYVTGGAVVTVDGATIEKNLLGVVLAGADSKLRLTDAQVVENADRGVWAQGLRATSSAPGLVIEGAGTTIRKNGVTGVGAVDSTGLAIKDAAITETVVKPVPIDVEHVADVGDGLGLFTDTGTVSVENVELADNGRAQALVDRAGRGIRFGQNRVMGGLHKVVIQHSTQDVLLPAADRTVTGELPLSAPMIGVPEP